MPLLVKAQSFLRNLLRFNRADADLDAEVHSHLAMLIDENIRAGMAPQEAQRAARIALGGLEQIKEEVRGQRIGNWLHSVFSDLRFAARQLRKNPGFTSVAVLTLALGIGSTTAIFSAVNAVVLRGLPFKDAQRLVIFHATDTSSGFSGYSAICDADYLQWQQHNGDFDGIAGFHGTSANLTREAEPEHLRGVAVTPSFFSLLGVAPALGRPFFPSENSPGHDSAVVLAQKLWAQKFGSSASVVGKTIILDDRNFTVVGVMPAGFEFPNQPEYWVPLVLTNSCSSAFDLVVAHLKPKVPLQQAQSDVNAVTQRLDSQLPYHRPSRHTTVVFLQDEITSKTRPTLLVLLAAVGLVLLIACSNVANLLLARALKRDREIAVRNAIGASRGRIVRQLITESVLLALLGGALGIVAAATIERTLATLIYQNPQLVFFANQTAPIRIDFWVTVFTLSIVLFTGILFGLAPALHCSGNDPQQSLKESGATASTSRNIATIRGVLVAGQFVLATVLLISAGLLIKSFLRLTSVNLGFDASHLLTMHLELPPSRYFIESQMRGFHRELLERIESLPDVRSAGTVSLSVPLGGEGIGGGFAIEGQPPSPPGVGANKSVVSPGYFSALQIPLLKGRYFSEQDTAESARVMIVNESFARRFLPNQEAVGHRIHSGFSGNSLCTVVGVIGDVRQYKLDEDAPPAIYLPYTQSPRPFLLSSTALAVRTASDPLSALNNVRAEILAVDPELPVSDITSMEQLVHQSVTQPRHTTILLSYFAAFALLLSATGVYSVMFYSVSERTREIGLRMALGAEHHDLVRAVIGRGMSLVLIGLSVGLVCAYAISRWISSFLFDVKSTDPMTFLAVSALLVASGLIACYIPARRATQVDPMVALRHE